MNATSILRNYFRLLSVFFLFATGINCFGQENINARNKVREEICLNGIWDFQPLEKGKSFDTGKIRVPGVWYINAWWCKAPGVIESGKNWPENINEINKAIYSKKILIPQNWKGSEIILDIDRLSTDAVVYIDENPVDTINWPGGTSILTDFVIPGKETTLSLHVSAAATEGEYFNFMGTATTQVTRHKQTLSSKGITGNVLLHKRPLGTHISDVFIQTSVKRWEIQANIEISSKDQVKNALLSVEIIDKNQKSVKKLSKTIDLDKNKTESFILNSNWDNPELWDLSQPNLYTANVTLTSEPSNDQYLQEFGFREFWIEGKDFYLNGKKINLRPTSSFSSFSGMQEIIDSTLISYKNIGFNFMEIWPKDRTRRGYIDYSQELIDRAAKIGFPIAAPLPPIIPFIVDEKWEYIWDVEGMKEKYENQVEKYIKRFRNNPAIIMWTNNPNFFGHVHDQNPIHIGQKNWIKESPSWESKAMAGFEGIKIVKGIDPSRVVINHHNSYVGDFQSCNLYLCLTPLQEREDYISYYSKFGKIPYMAIEFGTPLECSFLRARAPFEHNIISEPLFTEHIATYFGNEAYTTETEEYRKEIQDRFISGQEYQRWQNNPVSTRLPAFQKYQELFIKNTWQSWRTFGISGGMVPWSMAHGWDINPKGYEKIKLADDYKGRKGTYYETVERYKLNKLNPDYWEIKPSARALQKYNNETLAYIAGNPGAFTSKDHSFFTGEKFIKQIILFNDTRNTQDFKWNCKVYVDGKEIESYNGSGSILPGNSQKNPVYISLPRELNGEKIDGKIIMTCQIGENTHKDEFKFRIFNVAQSGIEKAYCFDPQGKTRDMLHHLGIQTLEWKGEKDIPFIIIGQNVFAEGYKLPALLEEYVKTGGKVLIMAQDPEWIQDNLGFRYAKHVSRYGFPVDKDHPVLEGLDKSDLRNWNGAGTLVESYPDYQNKTVKTGMYGLPYYGYHWGNRGSISCGALEKPHFSSWKPIIECEFDLAYSPLLEMNYGKGMIILSMLDLEDNCAIDPAARKLGVNLINYLANHRPEEKNKTSLVFGNDNDKYFSLSKLNYTLSSDLKGAQELIIIKDISGIDQDALKKYVKKGGKVIVLSQNSEKGIFNIKYKHVDRFAGSLKVPTWKEMKGISVSDLRWRTNHEVWVLDSGCEIASDGLFGKMKIGKGVMIFTQIDPERFSADQYTYFRYTRWRQNRALSQLISNMGGSFAADQEIFSLSKEIQRISLEGNWNAKVIKKEKETLSLISDIKDQGVSQAVLDLTKPDADLSGTESVSVPMPMEKYGDAWSTVNGEVVFRKTIQLPESFVGKDLILDLGVIDDYDITFFNGEIVGRVDKGFENHWGYERRYTVPSKLTKPGNNIITIRVFDVYGQGGLLGSEKPMTIYKKEDLKTNIYYHPDYIDEFIMGDDPFRFFRW